MRVEVPLTLLLVVGCGHPAVVASPCGTEADLVVVDTRAHVLWLCSERRPVARVRVALGRGGVDKRREGDGRTPIGTYSLGAPRASSRFGTFIPIGYPTDEQKARGFTGKDVGIHGPERRMSWIGSLSTHFDWTAGCVATANDDEIASVAAFVRERTPRVLLR